MSYQRLANLMPVLALAALLSACGGAQSRFAAHMSRGQTLYSSGDFAKASIEFRNAVQIMPKDPNARVMAAHAAEKLGRPRDAAALYQSVVDDTPDNVEARAGLGRLMIFGGVPERGLKVIEPALVTHPEDPQLLTLRAAARVQLKDSAAASADLDRALQLAPGNAEAVALRARMFQDAGEPQRALALVGDAVQRAPGSAELREILADLYLAAGEPVKAEEQLRALIALKPEALRYRSELAGFYARSGQLDEAQRVFEAAVQALPKSNDAKLLLVSFLSTQRGIDLGEKTLRDYADRDPDNYELRLALGALLQDRGATQEALAAYDAVVARDGTGPSGLVARDRIAEIATLQGRYADARKLIDAVLAKNPLDTTALSLRGEIALRRGDAAAAIADLRAVLRDQPQSIPVYQLLARAHIANGEPALAEQALHSALDVDANNPAVRVQLATILMNTQRSTQALAMLEDTVRVAPDDPVVREALARAFLKKRDFAAARRAAEELTALRPDSAVGPYLTALADEGAGHLEDAQHELEHALAQQPQADDVLTDLVRVEVARHENAQALALLTDITQHAPHNALAVNLLGETYLAGKNVAQASDAFTRASQLAPTWWVPYHNLAAAKLAAGDRAGAIAAYDAGIRQLPADTTLITNLAQLYEREDRVDEAISTYESSYGRKPTPIIARNLALLLVTYRSDQRSLDRARDLVSGFASSNDGALLDASGWVLFKRAEYSDALPLLERAAQRAPDSREIHYHLGMAELHAGASERARSDLENSLSGSSRAPWSDAARAALASLKTG